MLSFEAEAQLKQLRGVISQRNEQIERLTSSIEHLTSALTAQGERLAKAEAALLLAFPKKSMTVDVAGRPAYYSRKDMVYVAHGQAEYEAVRAAHAAAQDQRGGGA